MLFRVGYVSRSLIARACWMPEISRILACARAYNPAHHITGILMFSQDCFVQTLEGPHGTVETLLNRIRQDPRHRDILITESSDIAERTYGDWSMAFVAGNDAIDALAGVETTTRFDPEDPAATATITRHLETFGA